MAGDFDEAQHPRADDGKFGAGSGRAAAILAKAKENKLVKSTTSGPKDVAKDPDEHHERRVADAREFAAFQARSKVFEAHGVNGFEHHVDQEWRAKGAERPGGFRVPAELHAKLQTEIDAAVEHATKHAEADTRKTIANEARALAAGHITAPPDTKLKAFEEVAKRAATRLDHVHETLDASARHAADEMAKLSQLHESLSSAGISDHESAHESLSGLDEAFSASHAVADAAHQIRSPHAEPTARHEYDPPVHEHAEPENDRGFSYHEPPERDPEDSDADHAERVADFEKFRADIDAHHDVFRRQADTTQAALEDLHATQTVALQSVRDELRGYVKAHGAAVREIDRIDEDDGIVNHKAFEHHGRDKDDQIVDRAAAADHEAATEASASLLSSELDHRSNLNQVDASDVTAALREGMRSAAADVRRLAKITGRSPSLAKVSKASSAEDDDE